MGTGTEALQWHGAIDVRISRHNTINLHISVHGRGRLRCVFQKF
jgi:hypothetical protein